MIDLILLNVNVIVNLFGFLLCLHILTSDVLNTGSHSCVLFNCFSGLVWFYLLYSSLFINSEMHSANILLKVNIITIMLIWIFNNYYGSRCILRKIIR